MSYSPILPKWRKRDGARWRQDLKALHPLLKCLHVGWRLRVGVPSDPSPTMKRHNKGGLKGGRVKSGIYRFIKSWLKRPHPPSELYIWYSNTARRGAVIIKVHFLVALSPQVSWRGRGRVHSVWAALNPLTEVVRSLFHVFVSITLLMLLSST